MVEMMRRYAWAITAFAWSVAEATLFFFVPDVLLTFIGLRRGLRDGLQACGIAAVGAAVGGVIMYLWSAHDFAAAHAAVLAVPAINGAMVDAAQHAMRSNWFMATLEGPLSRTPYKVYAILAPGAGAPLAMFALASIAARLPRFLLATLAITAVRRLFAPRLGMQTLTWALVVFWVLFYVVFFAVTPSA